MKKRRNYVAILGIIALLFVGYLIPSAVMKLEDIDLWEEKKSIKIEAIQLDNQKVDVIEELSVFAEMLLESDIVEVDGEIKEEHRNEMQQLENEAVKDSEEETVSKSLYQNIQEFLTMLDVKEEFVIKSFSAQNYVMMVKEKFYSIWVCAGTDSSGAIYYFWVDAATEMVMAFDVPYEIIGKTDEAFYTAMMSRLVAYYDFEKNGLPLYSFSEEHEYLYKTKYWSNNLQLYDKAGKEQLSICIYKNGDRLLFNTK